MNIPKASAPEQGKYIFGAVKVGQKGQIVIPKDARDVFGIQPGDSLVVLGDEANGLALISASKFRAVFASVFPTIGTEESK